MPLYEFRCSSCGLVDEFVFSIAERKQTPSCRRCTCAMTRIVSRSNIQMDYPGYQCPVTGKWVEGRKAHAANLKQHGCRILETGEKEAAMRRKQEMERDLDRKVEETAGKLVHLLPEHKRQELVREAQSNPDIQIVRQSA